MTTLDEGEHQRLQDAIGAAEKFLVSQPNIPSSAFTSRIEANKQRVNTLEQEGVLNPDSHDRKKSNSANAIAVAALVAQETKLSHEERQTYAGFLHQDSFFRKDFEKLDEFYADGGAWDRLSADGKTEMSQRFWTGVERGEYEVKEAPATVRKKKPINSPTTSTIPSRLRKSCSACQPRPKKKFIRAYDSGDRKSAQEVLSGKDLFESSSKEKTHAASSRREEAASRDPESREDLSETKEKSEDNHQDTSSDLNFLASLDPPTETTATELPKPSQSGQQTQI